MFLCEGACQEKFESFFLFYWGSTLTSTNYAICGAALIKDLIWDTIVSIVAPIMHESLNYRTRETNKFQFSSQSRIPIYFRKWIKIEIFFEIIHKSSAIYLENRWDSKKSIIELISLKGFSYLRMHAVMLVLKWVVLLQKVLSVGLLAKYVKQSIELCTFNSF